MTTETGWSDDMAEAPRDRHIIVEANSVQGLLPMICLCRWHPDAGFCVDELREVVRWRYPVQGEELREAAKLDEGWAENAL